ncbi:MAG TPA: hypothetical protein VJM47_00125 [Nitrosospira sp.]|nr:hypothetical protein [Nitrosospira sp.]
MSLNFPYGTKLDRANAAGGASAIKAAFDATHASMEGGWACLPKPNPVRIRHWAG